MAYFTDGRISLTAVKGFGSEREIPLLHWTSMTMVDDVYKLLHRLFCLGIPEKFPMPVIVEMHNTGNAKLQQDVVAMIEHVLSDRSGEWRVSILGSQASDQWEMKIFGPNAFERSYMLEGTAGQHQPKAIASIVSKMVPS
jgi:hypothetical protein